MSPRPLAPHGTWGAYRRHLRNTEQPCDACAAYVRQRGRERRAAKKAARARKATP